MKLISEALVKAQKQFKPVSKDSENPFFKSSYADLSSILQSVMPVLSSNGLALSQPMRVDSGVTILMTVLVHESGEIMKSEMILPVVADPQKFGSLITYYKRYQLQAMLGISTKDEDDDANYAANKYEQKPNYEPKKEFSTKDYKSSTGGATDAQLNAIKAICAKKGIPNPQIKLFEDAKNFITEQNKR